MDISCVKFADLSPEQIRAWSAIQETVPHYVSPYFRPEYAEEVDAVRDDVEIAVLEKERKPVGFFPFQRKFGEGLPLSSILSDFHGAIVSPGVDWNLPDITRACRLRSYTFDHLLPACAGLEGLHISRETSPVIDLIGGFDEYQRKRKILGNRELSQALRKGRKAEREIGEVRFVAHTEDADVFDKLLEWKRDQYHRTVARNAFSFPWVVELLQRIMKRQEPRFSGMCSALYYADELAAVHFGMRSGPVLHYWFPAYNTEFSRYSPGIVLLVEVMKRCEELGVSRIDLGKGDERYKVNLMTHDIPVAEGSIDNTFVRRHVRGAMRQLHSWFAPSLPRGIKRPLRAIKAAYEQITLG